MKNFERKLKPEKSSERKTANGLAINKMKKKNNNPKGITGSSCFG
jgi:hypothetical protein